jgi:holo-[acyl-carrier protein] synthase
MNIVGHGIDVVEIEEIQRWVEDPRDPFVPRCFAQEELDDMRGDVNRVQRLAGRFAAKEAVLKALGIGLGAGIAFSDVVITRRDGDPPQVTLRGGAATIAEQLKVVTWRISISHSARIAIGSAIALSDCCKQQDVDESELSR